MYRLQRVSMQKFLDWYNPRIGFFRSSLARVGSLFLRKKIGTKKWKEILVEYEGGEKDGNNN